MIPNWMATLTLAAVAVTLSRAQVAAPDDAVVKAALGLQSALIEGSTIRPIEQVDYDQISSALEFAIVQGRKSGDLWRRIRVKDSNESPGVLWYHALLRALDAAYVRAPTSQGQSKWAAERYALVLRMLREPRSQKLVAAYGASEPSSLVDKRDWTALFHVYANELVVSRQACMMTGLLKPTDWLLACLAKVITLPGAVKMLDGMPYADIKALRSLGFDMSEGGASVTIRVQDRSLTVPIKTMKTLGLRSTNSWSRNARYVPVLDLHRNGLCNVMVDMVGQTVQITPVKPGSREPLVMLAESEPVKPLRAPLVGSIR